MKRFISTLVLALVLGPNAFARLVPPTAPREQSLLARVTVYWASGGRGSDRYTRQHKCATGMRLRQGHCAVDPRKIPYGSQVVFPDGTSLAAVDTGTAVKNRKAARQLGRTVYEKNAIVVDRFFETKRQALSWASKNPHFIPVKVVPPGRGLPRQQPVQGRTQTMVSKAPRIAAPAANYSKADTTNGPIRNPFNRLGR